MKNKRILAVLLALILTLSIVPVLPSFAAEYGLEICGLPVNDSNKGDILGDGSISYDDSQNVLYIHKDIIYAGDIIVNNVPGLEIRYDNNVELLASPGAAITTHVDLTINGCGNTLNLSAADSGVFVKKCDMRVTVRDANLKVNAKYGLTGSPSFIAKLSLQNAEIFANCGEAAVCEFNGDLNLGSCKIESPVGGSVKNGAIVDSTGAPAKIVHIVPGAGEDYDLEICGVTVNDGNKDNVLGDGKFVYDSAANVLTVKGETSYDGVLIGSAIDGLTIKADGEVRLTTTSTSGYDEVIGLNADTTMTGSFTLKAAEPVDAIYIMRDAALTLDKAALKAEGYRAICGSGGKLTVKDSAVTAKAATGGYAVIGFNDGIILAGCKITVPAHPDFLDGAIWDLDTGHYAQSVEIERSAAAMTYPIWIAGVQVDEVNQGDVLGDGFFEYNPYSNRLFIRGDCEYAGDAVIKSDQKDLTVIVEEEADLTCTMSGGCGMYLTNDTVILGGKRLTCYSDNQGYGIYLSGSGKLLTIEDAIVGGSGWYGGITAVGSAKITINCSAVAARALSGSNAGLSADNRLEINNCILEQPVGGSWDTMRVYDSLGNVADFVVLSPELTQYPIAVDGVLVTSANKDNILHDTVAGGRFSYDPATNTLYLGGNYTSEDQPVIITQMPELTINLKRSCTLAAKNAPVIVTGADTKIKSDDSSFFLQLNGDTDNACVQVDTTNEVTLSIIGLSLYLTGDYGLCGYNNSEKLYCELAYIWAGCTEEAICDFGGGITLYEERIVRPCGGTIIDGDICDRDGNVAGIVEIRRDSFLHGELWRVMFVTDHGQTPPEFIGAANEPIQKPADPTEEGWKFLGWYTDDAYAEAWDFSKPGGAMTLYAKWEPGSSLVNPFIDVKESDYWYNAVLWAYYHTPQITTGTSATKFSPNNTCTRAQIVTFLWRAKGCPEPTLTESPFVDVKDTSQYYYKAVLWAVENGITTGTDATHFSPNKGCTRAQVVTFQWRANGKPAPGTSTNPFTDVKADQYYYDAVLWAVGKGVTTGTTATTFSPDKTCTRGQIVTFLYRDLA